MTLEKLSKKLKKRFAGFIDTTEIRPPVIFDGFSLIQHGHLKVSTITLFILN